MTRPRLRRALVALTVVLVSARAERTADPASCRRYLEGAERRSALCPGDLLFDTASDRCMPAPVASCGTDVDAPPAINRTTLRKCCPKEQLFDWEAKACVGREEPWQPQLYAHNPFNAESPKPVPTAEFDVISGFVRDCDQFTMNTDPEIRDELVPLDNGLLYVPAFRHLYAHEGYCIETIINTGAAEGAVLGGAVCGDNTGVTLLPDYRPLVTRCCARFIPIEIGYSNDTQTDRCNFDAKTSTEPPPPLVDMASASGGVRYEIAPPECNGTDVVFLRMGAEQFLTDGFGAMPFTEANVTLAAGEFCLNEGVAPNRTGAVAAEPEPAGAVAVLCTDSEQRAELHKATVKKCCPPGMEVDWVVIAGATDRMECVKSDDPLEDARLEMVAPGMRTAPLMIHMPFCPEGLFQTNPTLDRHSDFLVRENGSFLFTEDDEYACHNQAEYEGPADAYCLDRKAGSDRSVNAFYCYLKTKPDDMSANYTFYPILMGITDFFLLVTFIVYLTVPDPTQTGLNKKRKLSQSVLGMILLAYISSLFFAYLVLMIVQTANSLLTQDRVACKVLAVILYFFLLAAFYWLSVICFEIYLSTRADKRTSGKKRFRLYALYAWGCPLLMASLALIMDLAPGIDNCSVIKPAFGRYRCLFQNRKAFIAYFYIPMGILLAICILLYVLTVKNLSVPSKMPGKDSSSAVSEQRAKQQSKRRWLCVKLFLVMGITWVAELAAYLIGDSPVWYFFDVINILQGFFIFVVFILRPKVLQYIKKTALQSLSRSFGHDSQHDHHQPRGGGPGVEAGTNARAARTNVSAPITMSTRVASTRVNGSNGSNGSGGANATTDINGTTDPSGNSGTNGTSGTNSTIGSGSAAEA